MDISPELIFDIHCVNYRQSHTKCVRDNCRANRLNAGENLRHPDHADERSLGPVALNQRGCQRRDAMAKTSHLISFHVHIFGCKACGDIIGYASGTKSHLREGRVGSGGKTSNTKSK